MLISKKWLSQYMEISDLSIEEIAERITNAGLEVEGIEKGAQATNLVIGHVESCVDHPDSDHLHVCQVNVGSDTRQIVCGAPNVAAGQKVIVALPGAVLPGGEIKQSVIRGQESNGMICSLLELGVDAKSLNDQQKAGIEVLGDDATVGDPHVLEYLGLDDEILDVSLTPNRSDCMAAFAMAKETGAILDRKVTLPAYEGASNCGAPTQLKVASMSEKCPLYSGKIIREVTIKESPKWMKELLMASNIKSINNVVDISNLVMLETGQPLHFFDLDRLEKEEIVVRDDLTCKYTALDEVEYEIVPGDLMITVNGKPVAIGGVMGGENSKIVDETKGILIEAALFDHVSVRNTARRLNLNTDASIRYQKGIEPNAPYAAMDRAVQLLIEYADAKGIEETVYSAKWEVEPQAFDVDIDRINQLLGTKFSDAAMMDVLTRLDFVPTQNGRKIHVVIPTYRQDITMEADIAEEIIRIIGFDDLPSTMPVMPATVGALTKRQQLRRQLRELFTNQGYYEAETYTLIGEKELADAILPLDSHVTLASPMSEERKIVRTSILPSLLESAAYNLARSIKDVPLFEISSVYSEEIMQERLALVLCGSLQKSRWQKVETPADFYTVKGLVETMLTTLGYSEGRVVFKENTMDTRHFHPYQSAEVYIGKTLFGIFGRIHPNMAKRYDMKDAVIGEFNMEVLLDSHPEKVKFTPISKYPSVSRDLAFVVDQTLPVANIIKSIRKCGKLGKENIIQEVEVFDVYEGEHVEAGKKSIALTITFQSADKTLTDQDINTIHEKVLDALRKDVNAELRA